MTSLEILFCPLCGNGESGQVLQAGPRQMARCRRCGLVYRNPRPPVVKFAQDAAADGLEADEDRWLAERRAVNFRGLLDRWADPLGKLLDVGCGHGWFLRMAKERGWEVVGVDISARAVAYARERLSVDARCGELRDFRFPDRSFRLVTLWNALEFVPDPVGLLQEIHRVLEPGGTLFIRTQNYFFQRLSFFLTNRIRHPDRPYRTFVFHLNSFSPPPLRFLLRRTGFAAVKVANSRPTWGDPYRAFGGADRLMAALKIAVHAVVQGLYLLSGRRWILGPSLEAWARREG